MKTIIAGSRGFSAYQVLLDAISESGFTISEVVSGDCAGPDRMGECWARGKHIPIVQFPAEWNKHGRAAGPIRNRHMAEYADALIAIWDGESRGTSNMITLARTHGLKVYVKMIGQSPNSPATKSQNVSQ